MLKRIPAFNKNIDLREIPAYLISEAAHYLQIPPATVRDWVLGRSYPTKSGRQFSGPIIHLPDPDEKLLSFMNLVEVHVLDAIRREHRIALDKVRTAVRYLSKKFPSPHPLADREFETDGINLFIQKFDELINISQDGQLAMRDLLNAHLRRIERDDAGVPIKLYPFTRKRDAKEPKFVVIDPRVSFGQPVLSGTGVPTSVIAERYKAGESIEELADDYGRTRLEIEEAIRCELSLEAA